MYVRGKGKTVFSLKPEGDSRATTNRDVAREIARGIRRRIEAETRGPQAQEKDLAALLKDFQAVNASEGSATQAKANASKIKAFLEGMALNRPGQVTVGAVKDWFVRLEADKLQPKTRKNHRGALSLFAEFLIERHYLDANPCRKVRIAKTKKLPPRFLSQNEYDRALALARENGVYAEVATALYTGMRRSELRRMKWADIDFDRAVVTVPRSKSGTFRTIPINEKLREVLLEQRAATGKRQHVFPGQPKDAYSKQQASGMRRLSWWVDAMKPLQEAMPIFTEGMADTATGRGWHLCRHTFASRLVQAGVPIVKVAAWLGHTDIRTTMIYAHLAPGHDKDIEHA
jgi:integrase